MSLIPINDKNTTPILPTTKKEAKKTEKKEAKINVKDVAMSDIGEKGVESKSGVTYEGDKKMLPQAISEKAVKSVKSVKSEHPIRRQKKGMTDVTINSPNTPKQIRDKIDGLTQEMNGIEAKLKESSSQNRTNLDDNPTRMRLLEVKQEIIQERAKLSMPILKEGKPFKSGLPEHLASAKPSVLNQEIGDITTYMIDGVPPIPINLNNPVKVEGETITYNNYGLTLKEEDIIFEHPDGICKFIHNDKPVVASYNLEEKKQAQLEGKEVPTQVFSTSGSDSCITNCDKTLMKTLPNGTTIFCVADGANWGVKVARAAQVAVNFSSATKERMMNENPPKNLQEVAAIELKALLAADGEINRINKQYELDSSNKDIPLEQKEKPIGTTTLLSGTIVKDNNGDRFGVFASCGDTKAFIFRKVNDQTVCFEVTKGSRGNLGDPSDCGGRIGNYSSFIPNGEKKKQTGGDYRNLAVYTVKLEPEDVLFICSDGIHDNFDPEGRGIRPSDFQLPIDSWKDKDIPQNLQPKYLNAKENWCTEELGKLYQKSENKEEFKDNVYSEINRINEPTKLYMLENPSKPQPTDYTKYQGKLDHAGSILMKIQ